MPRHRKGDSAAGAGDTTIWGQRFVRQQQRPWADRRRLRQPHRSGAHGVRHRKTDYGTVILHWLFVAAFAVALFSGLRIATESPERTWINLFDVLLPRDSVWTAHMQAAVVLVAVALGLHHLYDQVRPRPAHPARRVRLRGLFGSGQARLSAVNACLYWIFFVTMLALLVSGGLLYFGLYSGYDVAMLHWVGTWVILAFAVLHVVTQYRSGGAAQLLRIFRPAPLPAPPPRLDAVELLDMLVEQAAAHPNSTRRRFRPPIGRPKPAAPARKRPQGKIEKSDAAGQCVRRRCRRGDHRRFFHRGGRSMCGGSPAGSPHQRCRRTDAGRRHLRPGVAVSQAVLADHRRRRQFRRQGRDQDRDSRRA